MTLRLDTETDQRLTEIAGALGISKAQAVVRAVEDFLATQSSDAVASKVFDKVLKRDAALLERLSDA
ncbi:MAG: hypothetical protein P8M68_05445 [Aquiluna sp.]|nr:hypothetical protein [Aquiluna sp.]